MQHLRAGLLALTAAALAFSTPAQGLVPVLNGDFALGDAGWAVSGLASVSDGVAKLGEDGCFGPEETGDVARIMSLAPISLPPFGGKIQYDYRIRTADRAPFDVVRVTLYPMVSSQGQPVVVDSFNPNPVDGICRTFQGTRIIQVQGSQVNYAARLLFELQEDGYGDRFYVELDNIEISV